MEVVRGGFPDADAAQARWNKLRTDGARANRSALLSGGAAAVLAVTAGVLGWNAWHSHPERGPVLAWEF